MFYTSASAATYLPDYEATYTITRDGKPTAEQRSSFKRQPNNQFMLKDVTKGTHGLASFTGFERTETTHYSLDGMNLLDIKHKMDQEVAFKNKSFKFTAQRASNTIEGKSKKKAFSLTVDTKPISSHMLPWWLSVMVCDGAKSIAIPVMKSKRIKTYQFKVIEDELGLIRVDRVYAPGTNRSTSTWLDKKMHCFPVKTRHQENDEPVIETALKTHQFKAT